MAPTMDDRNAMRDTGDRTGSRGDVGVSPKGLTDAEAASRRERDGPNEISEERRSALLELLGHWWGPIPWMIEVALALSLLTRHWADAAIIGALLLLNGGVSFWEEHQAGNAIEALRRRLANEALVRRSGVWRTVDARELVVGDVVGLHLGDVVPADLRLLDTGSIEVDQSALTGESLPVESSSGDLCYSGSIVTLGETTAVVVATGERTYFGRAARLVEQAGTVSHFQRAVLRIARYLIVFAVALVATIVVVGLARGNPTAELLEYALVVTVASIPVALPAVLSVTMAVGATDLARQDAVVSHLASIEELGGVDVLCADKTGTLTENRLRVGRPRPGPGVEGDDVVRLAALASRPATRDVIDRAVLDAATGTSSPPEATVEDFVPFDPVRKRAEATVRWPDGRRSTVAKGASQVIAALLDASDPATPGARQWLDDEVATLAADGFRSLAVATTDPSGTWTLVGVIPLADPPRADSRQTIDSARALGVTVKMVTGDQEAIARRIGDEVGLGDDIRDAEALDVDPEATERLVEESDGFAQVLPEHKYRIVSLLQTRGHLVAMTGDGVNDAPALKQADAGIAVAGATDAARAAADIVLLAPGLRVIVDAIRTSRQIFERMTSYATYRITETLRVLLFITAAIIFFDVFPVTTPMIVLLALLNDGAILAIAYDRASVAPAPVTWRMRTVLTVATVLGVAGVVASFTLFALADTLTELTTAQLQTLMYLKLSVAGHLTIFVTRTRGPFWSSPPSWLLLVAVLGTQTVATVIAAAGILVTGVGWQWAAVVWLYALAWFVINDQLKVLTYRLIDPPGDAPERHDTRGTDGRRGGEV
jgi:H+-transporting ATPase